MSGPVTSQEPTTAMNFRKSGSTYVATSYNNCHGLPWEHQIK
jgi:hypothetical protein